MHGEQGKRGDRTARFLKTDESERRLLCAFLRREDVVAMEVCG
jgi:hypothetical protein